MLKQVSFNLKSEVLGFFSTISNCDDTCAVQKKILIPFWPLICNNCNSASLKLKDSALIVQGCEGQGLREILVQIIDRVQLVDSNGCPTNEFKITVEYEDTQLADPETYSILPCDIEAIDCFTTSDEYLQKQIECFTGFQFTISADSGASQSIVANDSIDFEGVGVIDTVVDGTKKVSFSIAPGNNGQILTTSAGVVQWINVPGFSTDSMVDDGTAASGAEVIKHTAADGSIYLFPAGFSTVKVDNDCADVGVGPDKSVRGVSIVSGELQVDAAPEHDTLAISSLAADWSPLNVLGNNSEYTLVINNPSTCRSMKGLVFIRWEHRQSYTATGLGTWATVGQAVEFNGILQTDFSNSVLGGSSLGFNSRSGLSIAAVGSVGTVDFTVPSSSFKAVTIPPNSSLTVDLTLQIIALLTAANITVNSVRGIQMGFIGSTEG